MNPITIQIKIGTIGELLVALRLLQYGVQSAPPLKDSGNDLIAVREAEFRAIQVKTSTGDGFGLYDLHGLYHIVALVRLVEENGAFDLEQSRIFLLTRTQIVQNAQLYYQVVNLGEYELCQNLVDELFNFEADVQFVD